MTLLEIVTLLSRLEPLHDNDMGDTPCFFCGEIDSHSDECIWRQAKKLIEGE